MHDSSNFRAIFQPRASCLRDKAVIHEPDVTMLSLPVELQEQVFDYLSRQDLLSLAQTCKINSFIANARLRAIIPELDPSTFTRCIRILAANPVRAAEILELNIAKYQFTPEPLGPSPPPPQRSALIATLKATIRKSSSSPTMPIEQTTLPCDPPRHPPLGPLDFSRAFTNLTRLRKLVIHAPQTPLAWMSPVVVATLREIYVHDGAESTPLLGWISYQPRINTLRIHCSGNKLREYRVSPPNSIFFPFLSLLTTNPEGASILLPESAVEDLCIEDLEYAKELRRAEDGVVPSQRPSLITAIRDSRERLRRLTLAGETDGIFKLLKTLAEGGVLLSHIRIVLCSERTESIKSLKWNSHAENAMPLLSGLEILEIFNGDLDQQHFVTKHDTRDYSYGMERNKSLMWGKKCPRLHTIRFPSSRWRIKREDGKLSVNRE